MFKNDQADCISDHSSFNKVGLTTDAYQAILLCSYPEKQCLVVDRLLTSIKRKVLSRLQYQKTTAIWLF